MALDCEPGWDPVRAVSHQGVVAWTWSCISPWFWPTLAHSLLTCPDGLTRWEEAGHAVGKMLLQAGTHCGTCSGREGRKWDTWSFLANSRPVLFRGQEKPSPSQPQEMSHHWSKLIPATPKTVVLLGERGCVTGVLTSNTLRSKVLSLLKAEEP